MKQIHRYREQTSDYQWREGKGTGNLKDGEGSIIMGWHEIMCMNFWKIQSTLEF